MVLDEGKTLWGARVCKTGFQSQRVPTPCPCRERRLANIRVGTKNSTAASGTTGVVSLVSLKWMWMPLRKRAQAHARELTNLLHPHGVCAVKQHECWRRDGQPGERVRRQQQQHKTAVPTMNDQEPLKTRSSLRHPALKGRAF